MASVPGRCRQWQLYSSTASLFSSQLIADLEVITSSRNSWRLTAKSRIERGVGIGPRYICCRTPMVPTMAMHHWPCVADGGSHPDWQVVPSERPVDRVRRSESQLLRRRVRRVSADSGQHAGLCRSMAPFHLLFCSADEVPSPLRYGANIAHRGLFLSASTHLRHRFPGSLDH